MLEAKLHKMCHSTNCLHKNNCILDREYGPCLHTLRIEWMHLCK